ncbi:MAG: HD domain-containing protein [Ghiorsea sp.]
MNQTVLSKKILQSLFVLAEVVEAKDVYTGGHLWRVSQFSRLLAKKAGLEHQQVVQIALGGFLHDLGKIGVPDAILNKPDRLTDDEYEVIKTHPTVGAELIAQHPLSGLVKDAIELHHERPDGLGYPFGRVDVPVVAQIVGITDAFDAMTSTRPYRKGMPISKALHIIRDCSGTQFDEKLSRLFIALHDDDDALTPIVGHTSLGIPLLDCPICGPTVHVHRDKKEGDHIYCRNCRSEFVLSTQHHGYVVSPTGKKGMMDKSRPVADIEAIHDLVLDALRSDLLV